MRQGRSATRNNQMGTACAPVIESLERRVCMNAADLDPTFGVGGQSLIAYSQSNNDFPTDLTVLSDGRVLLAGDSYISSSTPATHTAFIARYLSTGQLDPTFGTGGILLPSALQWTTGVNSFAVLPDGSIVACGSMSGGTNNPPDYVQKFTANGQYDPSWLGPGSVVFSAPLQVLSAGGGKTLVVLNSAFIRLSPNGSPDTTYGNGGTVTLSAPVQSAAIQADGSVVACGLVFNGSNAQVSVRRFHADGSPDTAFGTGGSFTFTPLVSSSISPRIVVDSNGKITVSNASFVARLTATGSLDTTFGGTGVRVFPEGSNSAAPISRLSLGPSGSVYAGGFDGKSSSPFLMHVMPDGTLDANFGSGGIAQTPFPGDFSGPKSAVALAAVSDGTVWFADNGTAPTGSTLDVTLVHVLTNGSLDPALGADSAASTDILAPRSGFTARISAMQPDGKLVIGGALQADTPAQFVAIRLNTDGTPDPTFGVNGIATINFAPARQQFLNAIAIQSDGKILLAGSAESTDPSPILLTDYAIARLNSNGTPDLNFGSAGTLQLDYGGSSESLSRVAVLSDGSIMAADATHLLHLSSDGSVDGSFGSGGLLSLPGPGTGAVLVNLFPDTGGKVVIGGRVTPAGSVARPFVERLNEDGSVDATFGNNGSTVIAGSNAYTASAFNLDPATGAYYLTGSAGASFTINRFASGGGLDSTFANAGTATLTLPAGDGVLALTVLPASKLLLSGFHAIGPFTTTAQLLRLTSAGAIDTAFGVGGSITPSFSDRFNQAFVTSTGRIVAIPGSTASGAWQVYRYLGASADSTVAPKVTAINLATDWSTLKFTFDQNVGASLSTASLRLTDVQRNVPISPIAVSYDSVSSTATFTLPPLLYGTAITARLVANNVRNATTGMLDGNSDGVAGDDLSYGFIIDDPAIAPMTASGSTVAHLQWTSRSASDSTRIQRSSDGVNFTTIATVGAGVSSYNDTGLLTGSPYVYRLQFTLNSADSHWSPAAAILPLPNVSNNLYIKKDADGSHTDVWINAPTPGSGAPTQQLALAPLSFLNLISQNNDINSTLNFANGNPLPAAGLELQGKGVADTLALIGTTGSDTLNLNSNGVTFGSTFGTTAISVYFVPAIQFHGGTGGNDVINVAGGSWPVDADTPSGTPNVSVNVSPGATATFASDQHLAGLVLNGGAAKLTPLARKTLNVGNLAISAGGTLDLGAGNIILNTLSGQPATAATVQALVKQAAGTSRTSGRHSWNGVGGITSSLAQADAASNNAAGYAIGIADAADNAVTHLGLLAGQVTARFAAYGDADLNNVVDIADLSAWNNAFAGGNHWAQGDFNYDGVVDIADLSIWNNNFAGTVAPSPAAPVETSLPPGDNAPTSATPVLAPPPTAPSDSLANPAASPTQPPAPSSPPAPTAKHRHRSPRQTARPASATPRSGKVHSNLSHSASFPSTPTLHYPLAVESCGLRIIRPQH